eukprot:92725-Hanusia_phi.AAC.1
MSNLRRLQVGLVCVVGCCYMWLSERCEEQGQDVDDAVKFGFPLSKTLNQLYDNKPTEFGLGYLARELACHCNERYCQRAIQELDDEISSSRCHCYRAVLQLLITDVVKAIEEERQRETAKQRDERRQEENVDGDVGLQTAGSVQTERRGREGQGKEREVRNSGMEEVVGGGETEDGKGRGRGRDEEERDGGEGGRRSTRADKKTFERLVEHVRSGGKISRIQGINRVKMR